jgi:hypothetical protein
MQSSHFSAFCNAICRHCIAAVEPHLMQVSARWGKPMETVNTRAIIEAIWPHIQAFAMSEPDGTDSCKVEDFSRRSETVTPFLPTLTRVPLVTLTSYPVLVILFSSGENIMSFPCTSGTRAGLVALPRCVGSRKPSFQCSKRPQRVWVAIPSSRITQSLTVLRKWGEGLEGRPRVLDGQALPTSQKHCQRLRPMSFSEDCQEYGLCIELTAQFATGDEKRCA